MDKETRNAIQSATQKARRLLEEDFAEQLEGTYDILTNGTVATQGGPHLTDRQHGLREKIVAAIEHKRAAGMTAQQAVADYLRDAAFTTINRYVALKVLEARGIVQECITRGEASSGFNEFCGLAPAIRTPDGSGYRLYLECVFDELSTEVKVLFDRRDPASVLWPKRATFDELLGILNAAELASVWGEDETIGWVYQFFNGQDERRKMREESQAPRNSRELAVRNQFFTPRYVVQFLSDNTLGRIWYEMRRGKTQLAETCEYMVRRSTEIFLGDPRQAYERIFGAREDGDYTAPTPVAATYRGDLSQLPEDDGFESRWISVAIPPDEITKISGEPYRPFEDDRIGGLINDLFEDRPNPDAQDLPLVWAAISRFTLNDGGGAYSLKPWKKLWSKFVELSRSDQTSKPEFVQYRALKDPRDMRVLDPACGSGHFLLYCFDLLLVMYEEAWADAGSPASEVTGKTLRQDYPDIAALKAALPGLILRHNLHGVDIDPRCAQIGQLALWMRAQRAFKDFGIGRADRPVIKRANIVIAEPMPGEKDLLKEFLAELKEDKLEALIRRALDVPAEKRLRVSREMADSLAELVETVWDGMKLAGEMGTLLKIERDLARAIENGRAEWEEDLPLFRVTKFGLGEVPEEKHIKLVPGAENDFWTKAETLVFQALTDYAAAATGSGNARRRLFAEDAAQGFALADLVAKKFDVVLMNPPFGAGSARAKQDFERAYPRTKNDVYAAFVERGIGVLSSRGRVGAITSRTGFFLTSFQKWREEIILKEAPPTVFADLGFGVLDSAMVETAAYCLEAAV